MRRRSRRSRSRAVPPRDTGLARQRSNATGLLGFDETMTLKPPDASARELADLTGEHRRDHRHEHEDEHDEREHPERHRRCGTGARADTPARAARAATACERGRPRGRSHCWCCARSTTAAPTSIRPCATNMNTSTSLCERERDRRPRSPTTQHDRARSSVVDDLTRGRLRASIGPIPTKTSTGPSISAMNDSAGRAESGEQRARSRRGPGRRSTNAGADGAAALR